MNNPKWGAGSPAYSFSTENTSHLLSDPPPRGSRVLSVCGSGDQAACCLGAGASGVICFDSNPRALSWARAKLSLMAELPGDILVEALMRGPGSRRARELILPFSSGLHDEALVWLDRMIDPEWREDRSLFDLRFDDRELKLSCSPWLKDPVAHGAVRGALATALSDETLSFHLSDIVSAPGLCEKGSLGAILLSNIAESPFRVFPESPDPDRDFALMVRESFLPLLSPGGWIMFGYSYAEPMGAFGSTLFRKDAYGDIPGHTLVETRVPTAMRGREGAFDTVCKLRRDA